MATDTSPRDSRHHVHVGKYRVLAHIASGGMGRTKHLIDAVERGCADAVAIADILHYGRIPLQKIRAAAQAAGIEVRAA